MEYKRRERKGKERKGKSFSSKTKFKFVIIKSKKTYASFLKSPVSYPQYGFI